MTFGDHFEDSGVEGVIVTWYSVDSDVLASYARFRRIASNCCRSIRPLYGRGRLVCEAHRLVYHSATGSRTFYAFQEDRLELLSVDPPSAYVPLSTTSQKCAAVPRRALL